MFFYQIFKHFYIEMSGGLPRRIIKVGSYNIIVAPERRIIGEFVCFCVEIFPNCLASNLLSFQETQRLIAEPVPGIKAEPHEENARYFRVSIVGPREVSC